MLRRKGRFSGVIQVHYPTKLVVKLPCHLTIQVPIPSSRRQGSHPSFSSCDVAGRVVVGGQDGTSSVSEPNSTKEEDTLSLPSYCLVEALARWRIFNAVNGIRLKG